MLNNKNYQTNKIGIKVHTIKTQKKYQIKVRTKLTRLFFVFATLASSTPNFCIYTSNARL